MLILCAILPVMESVLRFIWRLLIASVYLLTAGVLAWFVLHKICPGDSWLPVRMVSYFAPWFFMALLPGLLIAWLARRRWLLRVVIAVLMLFGVTYWPVLLPGQDRVYAESNSRRLRVMTFNVNFSNKNADGIAGLIATEAPDMIAFQEMTAGLFDSLYPKLKATHPYYLVDNSWGLPLVLVSRYPLTSQPKPSQALRAQHAAMETFDRTIAIWNVHPNPVVTGGWESQRDLLKQVADDVALEERPVIVLGDFNTTDQTDNYRLLADRLIDVYWAAGRGFAFTWPDFGKADTPDRPWYLRLLFKVGPVIGIDHIFVSKHFTPQKSYVVPNAYQSDHRPMVAELLLEN